MKLDNETKKWLDDLARQGCNQRDVANQLMQRLNVCIETDPPIYPSSDVLTYEHAVNLYKSARKRVRKSDTNQSWAAVPLKLATDAAIKTQAYVDGLSSVTKESNNEPAGVLIPVEADDLCVLQVSLERPEQAPEAATPSQATPSPSAALPEPPAKDPPAPFNDLFPGLNPSAAPPLSKYVSEVIANGEQEIGTNNYSNMVKSDPITRDTLQAAMDRRAQEYADWCKRAANHTVFAEKTQTPQVKNYRYALCNYIDFVVAGGEKNPAVEESYADDAHLVDQLVSLLGPEIKSKWDNCQIDHDQVESMFRKSILDEDDLEKAFWDFDTCRKRGSERDAFKMVVRAALTQRGLFNSTSKPDIVLVNAQVEMVNGIRDLTDAVRALPIASVIAAKDETIAAKDAELETLREYVRHLQRQVGAS